MEAFRQTLKNTVPTAGFCWYHGPNVLRRKRQDRVVIAALRNYSGVADLHRGAPGNARRPVELALAEMFDTARRAVEADPELLRTKEAFVFLGDDLWRSGVLAWARAGALSEDLFIDLFFEVYRRRLDWHENPREPFNISDHGPLAHSVDAFHRIAGQSWGEADFDMWAMAQAPETEKCSDAGVRKSQLHNVSTDVDEGEDMDMKGAAAEVEMEKVRERLALANLGGQEDVEMKDLSD